MGWRKSVTASFIMDFASAVGVQRPPLTETEKQMLDDFMQRVEEWTASEAQQDATKMSALHRTARRALLASVQLEQLRGKVKHRWSDNWNTTEGTLLNFATAGLAAFAAIAT